jgi:hypothetical protein
MISEDRLGSVLAEFEGYDKHGCVDDALTAARLLAQAVRELLSLRTSPPPSGEAGEVTDEMVSAALSCRPFDSKTAAEALNVFDAGHEDWMKAVLQAGLRALPTIKEPTAGDGVGNDNDGREDSQP